MVTRLVSHEGKKIWNMHAWNISILLQWYMKLLPSCRDFTYFHEAYLCTRLVCKTIKIWTQNDNLTWFLHLNLWLKFSYCSCVLKQLHWFFLHRSPYKSFCCNSCRYLRCRTTYRIKSSRYQIFCILVALLLEKKYLSLSKTILRAFTHSSRKCLYKYIPRGNKDLCSFMSVLST